MRRLFGTLLFIESLFDEEALIAELAPDTMKIEFPYPKELFARNKTEKKAVKAEAATKAAHAGRVIEPLPLPYIESSLNL